jgi:6,7-dimethyl-8-ribityllumazine synthase
MGLRFAVVVGRFNHPITSALLDSCAAELVARGATDEAVHVAWVPGAFEIPLAARKLAQSGRYDAIITLGAVIRGGTPHFEYVCQAATDGLARVAADTGVPVGFGLLTCDDEAQALDRAGLPDSHEDKGREAAEAALSLALTLPTIRRPGGGITTGF